MNPSRITIDALADSDSRFIVHFNDAHITTVVTASGEEAEDWIEEVLWVHRRRLSRLIVGLDVEWRPNFSRRYNNPAAVLQLCVGQRCLVFQLLHCDYIPDALSDFLSDDRFTFTGVGVDEDVEKLVADHDLSVANAKDLSEIAAEETGRGELRREGLKGLAREVLGRVVEKPRRVRLGRWDRESLNMDQIKYACVDAFVSFEIARDLIG
ncbi:hypothetical protein QJS04_geneDACA022301 [Acorus gramineus]|uniref:3'-5' exonuclease domain-containing protein n=1 Tax=Acorus gramineus TaxID=55184 RepID=A0AAV9B893_ACOGR|nr:hypothetical protein QJS04_geneDACA022301 [Acorus gramineus]